jgi:hypothetical protein
MVDQTTTISIDGNAKESLESFRHPSHENWTDTVEAILRVLPTPEEIRENGCANEECEMKTRLPHDAPIDETGGVIRWFSQEFEGEVIVNTDWFCSAGCAEETQVRVEEMAGHDPDHVFVGGAEEMQVALEDADFYIDGQTREVCVDVPGAFAGESYHGHEYEYEGEPVYVYNSGTAVQRGVVGDIIHEETRTIILLDHDSPGFLDEHEPSAGAE